MKHPQKSMYFHIQSIITGVAIAGVFYLFESHNIHLSFVQAMCCAIIIGVIVILMARTLNVVIRKFNKN